MIELLLTCPWCKQAGFSERGLRAHYCRARDRRRLSAPALHMARKAAGLIPLPAQSSMPKTSSSLAIFSQPQMSTAVDICQLKASIAAELKAIAEAERDTSLRGVWVGLRLWQAKATVKHGEFRAWCANNVEQKRSQINNLMRLAEHVGNAVNALPGEVYKALDAETPHKAEGIGRAFVDRVRQHIGDLSLNELLIKHGIKGVGLRSELTAGEEEQLTPEQRLAALRDRTWQESFDSLQRIRSTLTEPERAALLVDPRQLQTLKSEVVELNKLLDDRLANLRALPA